LILITSEECASLRRRSGFGAQEAARPTLFLKHGHSTRDERDVRKPIPPKHVPFHTFSQGMILFA